ncbi:hypothetical protein BDV10DRAFT_176365 [Aspergillus recurvatus]
MISTLTSHACLEKAGCGSLVKLLWIQCRAWIRPCGLVVYCLRRMQTHCSSSVLISPVILLSCSSRDAVLKLGIEFLSPPLETP